ncbi:MAG: UDP-N-acetylmuramoyl-tripeptide--D-alanyl-D-alanine ligase [Flavobacteriaceae bacterium]|nr:UDP-N-acetylmuramoyl-tripeptide--D-alanyl-D-alanine ligase [Flavobacteriaceae bacterium]
MEISQLYALYSKSFLVSTDTRKIIPNSIFFGLKGDHFNGNAFAEEAIHRGAAYAIVDEQKFVTNDRIFLVKNVLKALQELATFHRRQLAIPIIALTGSNGKTTTKELINAVLSKKYKTTATLGNLNNHIGVPLTLLAMTPQTELGIVEMGANHLKEIEFLCVVTEPDYGYITNFGKAHLEGFGSLKGVIKGKSELYDYLRKHDKKAFINANDVKQLEMTKGLTRISFGDVLADVKIAMMHANPFVSLKYRTSIIQSQLIGAYNFNNIAAAITIGNYFKVDDTLIIEAIENYIPSNNRSQIIQKGSNKIILDAYNANPSSMEAALENFSALADGNKMVILGDMFELGEVAKEEHQRIADLAIQLNLNKVYLLGDNFYQVNKEEVHRFRTFEEFKNFLSGQSIENATILIKASRGMALERIVDLL